MHHFRCINQFRLSFTEVDDADDDDDDDVVVVVVVVVVIPCGLHS